MKDLRRYATPRNLVLLVAAVVVLAMGWLKTLVAAVVIIGLIASAHEFGHFLASKVVGVRVDEFSLGLGSTKLLAKTWGETEYSVRPIPLGAFVRPAGMDPGEEYEPGNDPGERSFARKGLLGKLLILAGGSLANILLTVVIASGLFWVHGDRSTSILVEKVVRDKPAALAGIRADDVITAVNGTLVTHYLTGIDLIGAHPRERIVLTVRRPTDATATPPRFATLEIPVVPEATEDNVGRIGILVKPFALDDVVVPLSFTAAVVKGTETTVGYVFRIYELTLSMFQRAFRRMEVPEQIGGPIKIFGAIDSAVGEKADVTDVLQLTASLSVSIGVFNLLPIPALDGGRILVLLLGWVLQLGYMVVRRRRPDRDLIPQGAEETVHLLGFAFLLLLLLVVSYKDLGDLVRPKTDLERLDLKAEELYDGGPSSPPGVSATGPVTAVTGP